MTVTGYLLLAAAAVIGGISLGGLITLISRCSKEADALIAEAEFLESIWADSHAGGGRASSDRVKATTPATVLHLVGADSSHQDALFGAEKS